jgi:hypothetical protein
MKCILLIELSLSPTYDPTSVEAIELRTLSHSAFLKLKENRTHNFSKHDVLSQKLSGVANTVKPVLTLSPGGNSSEGRLGKY